MLSSRSTEIESAWISDCGSGALSCCCVTKLYDKLHARVVDDDFRVLGPSPAQVGGGGGRSASRRPGIPSGGGMGKICSCSAAERAETVRAGRATQARFMLSQSSAPLLGSSYRVDSCEPCDPCGAFGRRAVPRLRLLPTAKGCRNDALGSGRRTPHDDARRRDERGLVASTNVLPPSAQTLDVQSPELHARTRLLARPGLFFSAQLRSDRRGKGVQYTCLMERRWWEWS